MNVILQSVVGHIVLAPTDGHKMKMKIAAVFSRSLMYKFHSLAQCRKTFSVETTLLGNKLVRFCYWQALLPV